MLGDAFGLQGLCMSIVDGLSGGRRFVDGVWGVLRPRIWRNTPNRMDQRPRQQKRADQTDRRQCPGPLPVSDVTLRRKPQGVRRRAYEVKRRARQNPDGGIIRNISHYTVGLNYFYNIQGEM